MSSNPFVTEEQAAHVESALEVIFSGAMITFVQHEGVTTAWVTLALDTVAAFEDAPESGIRALLWELSRYVEEHFDLELGQPECGHEACVERAHYELSFLEAAMRGEHELSMNVVKVLANSGPPERHVEALKGFTVQLIVTLVRCYLRD